MGGGYPGGIQVGQYAPQPPRSRVRDTQDVVEVVSATGTQVRDTQDVIEVVSQPVTVTRDTQDYIEVVSSSGTLLRITSDYIEVVSADSSNPLPDPPDPPTDTVPPDDDGTGGVWAAF